MNTQNKSKTIGKNRVPSYEAAIYGSISGGVAAAITTPLDVLKTRVMTAEVKFRMKQQQDFKS